MRYAWVVEVLLDEVGVWTWQKEERKEEEREHDDEEGEAAGRWAARRNRERRWGAVDVLDGVRVVDAFPRGTG